MKYSSPFGPHSGWQIDSLGPPATFRAELIAPSASSSPTQSSVPSHGMLGWFHVSQASRRPSGLSLGDE